MKKILIVGLSLSAMALLAPMPVMAQMSLDASYYGRVREGNALRDSARAQERQADSLRQIERYEHDRNLREDRQMRIDNRDRRDSYRR